MVTFSHDVAVLRSHESLSFKLSLYVRTVWETISERCQRGAHVKTVLIVHWRIERNYFCCFIGLERLNTHTCMCQCPSLQVSCVISGSDVGSKWWLLCSLLHSTTKHLNRLGVILVYNHSGVETMVDWWQLTQGRAVIKPKTDATVNQQSWEGRVQNYVILPRIWDRLDMRKGFGFIEI